ncbi:ScbR family autoregulator-binding transcription factor [Streptomyces prunicolor]|jgi:AcrR family transcriptional regulator|uniref:ScbR family autoregulator-binding transcription factor n=1 Tax=Streptomyces prunicolor TaxID=67348 RepID=UPI00344837E9
MSTQNTGLRPTAGAASRPRELKQERAARTRDQILNAAAEAFAGTGFPAVTILDVAELAGVTKGAVYFHFANKEALAVAVAEEFYALLPAIAETVRTEPIAPLDAVAELLIRTATAFRDNRMIQAGARLQIERHLVEAAMPTPFTEYTHLIADLLAQAQSDGQLPASSDPQAMARVVVAAFFGGQHISWVLHDRKDLAERVREIIDVILP